MANIIMRRGRDKAARKASRETLALDKVAVTKAGAFLYIGAHCADGTKVKVWLDADAARAALVPSAQAAVGGLRPPRECVRD